ncbi:hypothetical protein BX666DRAFT_955395 [Dichotomocladium elegans]|nr:hypothetical protein BX666DRAFT_955395 [Dichotomocladium elegans]
MHIKGLACLSTVYTFWIQVSSEFQDPAYVYSRGFWSCLSAGIITLFGALAFGVDWFLGYPSSSTLSLTLKAMVLPAVMVCSTIIWGASVFMIFEDWTYSESLMLCWVSVTTIGYGDIAPKSTVGRIFFIVYTIAGISVVGYMLLSIRAVITGSSSNILKVNLMRVESLQEYSREQHQKWLRRHQQHDQAYSNTTLTTQQENHADVTPEYVRTMHRRQTRPRSLSQASTFSAYTLSNIINDKDRQILVQVITRSGIARMTYTLILCWFGGAGVFCALEENWTYLDGLYFAFCTQMTIGFGDIVPQSVLAQEFWLVYIVISIAVAAYFISLFGDALVEKLQVRYGQDSDDDDAEATSTSDGDISFPGYNFPTCEEPDGEDGSMPEAPMPSMASARSKSDWINRSFAARNQFIGSPPGRRTVLNDERTPLVRYASMPTVGESASLLATRAKASRRSLSYSARRPLHQGLAKMQRGCNNRISSTASLPSIDVASQLKYAAVDQSTSVVQSPESLNKTTDHLSHFELADEDLIPDTEPERPDANYSLHHSRSKKSSKYIPIAIASARNGS